MRRLEPVTPPPVVEGEQKLTRNDIENRLIEGHTKIGGWDIRIEQNEQRWYSAKCTGPHSNYVYAPEHDLAIGGPSPHCPPGIKTFCENLAEKLADLINAEKPRPTHCESAGCCPVCATFSIYPNTKSDGSRGFFAIEGLWECDSCGAKYVEVGDCLKLLVCPTCQAPISLEVNEWDAETKKATPAGLMPSCKQCNWDYQTLVQVVGEIERLLDLPRGVD